MPEEINRLLTDQISDLLFTPSDDGDENLIREGIDQVKIHRVGNVMIDSLVRLLPCADESFPAAVPEPYALLTLHRPSNVDDLPWLQRLLTTLSDLSSQVNIVFPVHPRTRQRLDHLGVPKTANSHLHLLGPLPYLEFIALERRAAFVITDSGGIQEETTFLGIPCLTVRENTERPITVTFGTNQLVGRDLGRLRSAVKNTLKAMSPRTRPKQPDTARVPLWDGHAAERIAQIIVRSTSLSNHGRGDSGLGDRSEVDHVVQTDFQKKQPGSLSI